MALSFIRDIMLKESINGDAGILEMEHICGTINILCTQAERIEKGSSFFKESMGETFNNFKSILKKILDYILKLYSTMKNLLMKIFGIKNGSSSGGGGGGGFAGVGDATTTDAPVPRDVENGVTRLNETHNTNINNNQTYNIYNVPANEDVIDGLSSADIRVQMERFIIDIEHHTGIITREFIKGTISKYASLVTHIISSDRVGFNNMVGNAIRNDKPVINIPVHAYISFSEMYVSYFIEDILPAIIPSGADEAKQHALDSIRANSRFTRRFVDDMNNNTITKFRGEFNVDRYNIARVENLNIVLNSDDVVTREVNVDMNLLDGIDIGADIMVNLINRYYSRMDTDISVKNVIDTLDNQIKDLESRISMINGISEFSEIVYTRDEIVHAIKSVVYIRQLDFWAMTYLNTTTKSEVAAVVHLMLFRFLLVYATEYKARHNI